MTIVIIVTSKCCYNYVINKVALLVTLPLRIYVRKRGLIKIDLKKAFDYLNAISTFLRTNGRINERLNQVNQVNT